MTTANPQAFHQALDPAMVFPATPDGVPQLAETQIPANPLLLMQAWLAYAFDNGTVEPNYVTLATASADGIPSSRTVHLLDIETDAVRFTTNFDSRKGVEMLATGRAAVSMYFRETAQSINFTGTVVISSDEESDERFAAEHRKVQASRVVSTHGRRLDDPEAQLVAFDEMVEGGAPIQRPDYWKYYRIVPDAVTFWEGHPEALNVRLHYSRTDGDWEHFQIEA